MCRPAAEPILRVTRRPAQAAVLPSLLSSDSVRRPEMLDLVFDNPFPLQQASPLCDYTDTGSASDIRNFTRIVLLAQSVRFPRTSLW